MQLLLINPKFPESFWSLKWAVDTFLPGVRTVNPPLGLATLAALCPSDWEIEIIDENTQSVPLEPGVDIIGVCGMGVQFARQKELLTYYKNKGYFVVAGGSYASLCPESYESLADTVVAGEAEYIWKEFCRDYQSGSPKKLYHETSVVSLSDSPVPRFDLLNPKHYMQMSMQFSRGCPYRCEFCDIIVMFGRRPRTKSLEQIGAELDELRKLNARDVFFVDDNLTGNVKVAKELLRFLRDYQKDHGYAFHFGTEASLNIADDDELLQLFREANFEWIFVGIESPNEDSLRETGKLQNTRRDMLSSVRKIYSHGIDVLGGFIIGFDSDTEEIFDEQYRFIVESGIQAAMIGLLVAIEKTPLYERLEKECRLIPDAANLDNLKLATNVIPKNMAYGEMINGYLALYHRLLDYGVISKRIRNKVRFFTNPHNRNRRSVGESLSILVRLLRHILRQAGIPGLYHLLRSFPLFKTGLTELVVHDWAVGLSMRDYVDRHFNREFEKERRLARSYLGMISRALQRYLSQGSLRVALNEVKNSHSNLLFSMKGRLGREFFVGAAQQLEKMLQNTRSSLTIRIEEFHSAELHLLQNMLNRLMRYRDRIIIAADEKSRRIIDIDSSIFNLAMGA
ncbi:MAG: radical SAM protein [Candidatus Latescibacteria bacterium]|nr:radical SAM protein [Candidatus Latescibacterota bacterium]NIO57273.1 radical SAM protein [Candidatus Latescibacterota bacterium]